MVPSRVGGPAWGLGAQLEVGVPHSVPSWQRPTPPPGAASQGGDKEDGPFLGHVTAICWAPARRRGDTCRVPCVPPAALPSPWAPTPRARPVALATAHLGLCVAPRGGDAAASLSCVSAPGAQLQGAGTGVRSASPLPRARPAGVTRAPGPRSPTPELPQPDPGGRGRSVGHPQAGTGPSSPVHSRCRAPASCSVRPGSKAPGEGVSVRFPVSSEPGPDTRTAG